MAGQSKEQQHGGNLPAATGGGLYRGACTLGQRRETNGRKQNGQGKRKEKTKRLESNGGILNQAIVQGCNVSLRTSLFVATSIYLSLELHKLYNQSKKNT
jgi:hypothetical protein